MYKRNFKWYLASYLLEKTEIKVVPHGDDGSDCVEFDEGKILICDACFFNCVY